TRFSAGLLLLLAATAAQAAEPLGASRCGSCHIEAYTSWSGSRHARSLERLTEAQRKDPTCRACHTFAPDRDDPALAGVQCESCHGEGSQYAPEHVMRDATLARMLGLKKVDASTCRACHEGVTPSLQPYDYRTRLREVAHGALDGSANDGAR
ncbi:MAG: multiheme c-type cytochrome, partial [Myxococcota bacterium]